MRTQQKTPAGLGDWRSLSGLGLVVVVLLVVGVRAVISARGYLYADDFAFRYWAATQPFGWDYLTQSYGGHVNPVGLGAQWVLQWLFPGSHLALVGFVTLLSAATLWLAGRTLLLLTDRWQAAVIGVVLLGVGLLTFENTTWWAGAIYAVPYQFFLAVALYALIRALRHDHQAWSMVVLVAFTGMVASYSRGVLGAVLLLGVAVALPVAGPAPLGFRGALRWRPWLWAGIAAVGAVSVIVTTLATSSLTRPGLSFSGAVGYAWTLLVLNLLPALWGGPWRWFDVSPAQWHPIVQTPAPPWWAVWMCAVATILVLWWLVVRRPTVRGFLPWVGLMVLVAIAVVSVARAGTFVESVAYRYTFDLAWPFLIVATLALVPIWWQEGKVRHGWWVLLGAFTLSAAVSTLVPAQNWMSNQGRTYVANAISGTAQLPPDYTMLSQGVPEDLIEPSLMRPYANTRTILVPQPGAPIFGDYSHGDLWGFDADGRLEKQSVEGPVAIPGPDPECGYRITDQPRTITLDGELIAWLFTARIAYFTGESVQLNVAVGGQVTTVPLRAGGLDAVYFPVMGPGTDILVSIGTPGAVACITDVTIGNRVSPDGAMVPAPLEGELAP